MKRRTFLQAALAAGTAPSFVPARVLGREGAIPPSEKINLGVVGCGAQGTWDLQAFLTHADVRVTTLCDVNQPHLEKGAELVRGAYGKADVKLRADFRELIADPSVDAVLTALPVHWHSIPGIGVILAGKSVYYEKPLALSWEEAARVRAAVRKKGTVFQFGTQQRSDQKFRWACELAQNGRLGKISEIQVAVSEGKKSGQFGTEAVPSTLDWDRWVGPAPLTDFHSRKLERDNHENITNFSLGMISCWGVHHLDIAQWGNGADATGPVSVQGTGTFPDSGTCDAIYGWDVRYEFKDAAPIRFVDEKKLPHGIRFIGEGGKWVHVVRGNITAHDRAFLTSKDNAVGTMPVKLPVSIDHHRNFLDAVRSKGTTIAPVESAMRTESLIHLAMTAIRTGRKLKWDPVAEKFPEDEGAQAMLAHRPFRGDWKLPEV